MSRVKPRYDSQCSRYVFQCHARGDVELDVVEDSLGDDLPFFGVAVLDDLALECHGERGSGLDVDGVNLDVLLDDDFTGLGDSDAHARDHCDCGEPKQDSGHGVHGGLPLWLPRRYRDLRTVAITHHRINETTHRGAMRRLGRCDRCELCACLV